MRNEDTEGATPIDPDEAEELIPQHIATREELNVWEQENILLAARWVRRTRKDPLADESIRELHRRMFDMTWNWAGRYRRTNKNIGIDWQMIPVEVRKLVLDGSFWLQNGTYPIDEAALRLHHRLVSIHAFPMAMVGTLGCGATICLLATDGSHLPGNTKSWITRARLAAHISRL